MVVSAIAPNRPAAIIVLAIAALCSAALAVWSPMAAAIAALVTAVGLGVIARRDANEATGQHALAGELARSNEALAIAEIGVWHWDLRTSRIEYSRSCATMLGYEDGEVDSTLSAWGKLVHPDDLERVRRAVDDLIDGRSEAYQERVRLRGRDGGWRTILDRGRITARDANGRPTLAVGVHVDVTLAAPPVAVAPSLRGKWVIVDDEPSVREVIEQAARRSGLDVVGFADARSALQAIKEDGVPLGIVTDYDMPGMTGAQLAERVRASGIACPVLLVSGTPDLQPGQCRAVDAILAKPFTVAELASWLVKHTAARPRRPSS